eukprot:1161918-Pelagomonas_calceolata.AAC.7
MKGTGRQYCPRQQWKQSTQHTSPQYLSWGVIEQPFQSTAALWARLVFLLSTEQPRTVTIP